MLAPNKSDVAHLKWLASQFIVQWSIRNVSDMIAWPGSEVWTPFYMFASLLTKLVASLCEWYYLFKTFRDSDGTPQRHNTKQAKHLDYKHAVFYGRHVFLLIWKVSLAHTFCMVSILLLKRNWGRQWRTLLENEREHRFSLWLINRNT